MKSNMKGHERVTISSSAGAPSGSTALIASTSNAAVPSASTAQGNAANERTFQEVEYLKRNLGPILVAALAEICIRRPSDPIEYLGHWLLRWRYNEELKRRDVQNALEVVRRKTWEAPPKDGGQPVDCPPDEVADPNVLEQIVSGFVPNNPNSAPGYGGPLGMDQLKSVLEPEGPSMQFADPTAPLPQDQLEAPMTEQAPTEEEGINPEEYGQLIEAGQEGQQQMPKRTSADAGQPKPSILAEQQPKRPSIDGKQEPKRLSADSGQPKPSILEQPKPSILADQQPKRISADAGQPKPSILGEQEPKRSSLNGGQKEQQPKRVSADAGQPKPSILAEQQPKRLSGDSGQPKPSILEQQPKKASADQPKPSILEQQPKRLSDATMQEQQPKRSSADAGQPKRGSRAERKSSLKSAGSGEEASK